MLVYAKPEQKQASKSAVQKKEPDKKPSAPNLTGIPDAMKARFENLSGFSFDNVRVHYNSDKPAQLQALAYTQGNQVYVGRGQEKHLGHELGHVVQQKSGRVSATKTVSGVNVNDNPDLETEADSLQFMSYVQKPEHNTLVMFDSSVAQLEAYEEGDFIINCADTKISIQTTSGVELGHLSYVITPRDTDSNDAVIHELLNKKPNQFKGCGSRLLYYLTIKAEARNADRIVSSLTALEALGFYTSLGFVADTSTRGYLENEEGEAARREAHARYEKEYSRGKPYPLEHFGFANHIVPTAVLKANTERSRITPIKAPDSSCVIL